VRVTRLGYKQNKCSLFGLVRDKLLRKHMGKELLGYPPVCGGRRTALTQKPLDES